MIKKFIKNEPLKNHTTFKIGGPAEYFFKAQVTSQLIRAVKTARKHNLAITMIGYGSNILVSDKGIKGLVIKNLTKKIKLLANNHVQLDSGVYLPKAIFKLINLGLTGLEPFASIPATVGGATYINIHGQNGVYWSDLLVSAQLLNKNNQVKTVDNQYFNFKYDYSVIQQTKEIVLTNILKLKKDSKLKALEKVKNFQIQKNHHPQISAGCIFQNLSSTQQEKLGLPTPSIGYLVDKVLNLKGRKINQAKISNKHAGFIENLGGAEFQDVLQLIKLVKDQAKKKLDLDLKLEVVLYG